MKKTLEVALDSGGIVVFSSAFNIGTLSHRDRAFVALITDAIHEYEASRVFMGAPNTEAVSPPGVEEGKP